MAKLKILDLFCGAGGAAMGYYRAGFDVVGIDIQDQPNYPFCFIQGDALKVHLAGFDAIHASPPCQRFSTASGLSAKQRREKYPDYIWPTREKLKQTGLPFIIENVENAPLINPVVICGTSFPNLKVIRHRLFECSFSVKNLSKCDGKHPKITKNSQNGPKNSNNDDFFTVAGNCSNLTNASAAMGIDWMNKEEINEAIPPDYTFFLGKQLIRHLEQNTLPS